MLRSAAATNEVRLHVRHFSPNLSNEYQKLLFDEKSTDDDDEEIHRILNHNLNRNSNNNNNNNTHQNRSVTANHEIRMRRASRTLQQEQQQYRHSTYNPSFNDGKDYEERNIDDRLFKGLDVSHDALQSILNSRFKLIDLIDLLKKTHPKIFFNDYKRELQFIQQVSETNTGNKEDSSS